MVRSAAIFGFCVLALMFSAAPAADDPPVSEKKTESAAKSDSAADKSAAPATHAVKKGPLKIALELEGVFESESARELLVQTDEWTALVVHKAAAHGARVRKGDVVLEFETEKIDRAIAELRTDTALAALSVRQSEDELKTLEKTTPLDLAASRRAAIQAEEDRKTFEEIERPFSLKAAEFQLKSARLSLEYEEEELRQLEKMYKADDITEETEAIVLQRARDSVERARFLFEAARLQHDLTLKFAIPRKDIEVKESTERALLASEKSRTTLPTALEKQRLELEKARWQHAQNESKLQRLLADRERLTVRAPIAGIVYYGKLTRGKPADSAALADSLRPGGGAQPIQVLMTVVAPRALFVRAPVPEAELRDLRPGLQGVAVPAGYPDLRLPATLDSTSDIPQSPGVFEARFHLDLRERTKFLVPGMSCKVKLTAYRKRDALTVPLSAVVDDELDDEKHTVEVLDKDGKTKTRSVKLGRKTEKLVEIVEGLSEGEKVLTEPKK